MHNSSRDAKPATTSTWAVVEPYIRDRLPYWTGRWLWIMGFLTVVSGSFRLREYGLGLSWYSAGLVALAFAIAFVGAMLVTVICLAVGGMLQARGIILPEWLTRRRGD